MFSLYSETRLRSRRLPSLSLRQPPRRAGVPPRRRQPLQTPAIRRQPLQPVRPLLAGMAFLGDVLLAADRIGELRHRRRLRKLKRQQAERLSRGNPPQAGQRGPHYLRVRPLRGLPKLPPSP